MIRRYVAKRLLESKVRTAITLLSIISTVGVTVLIGVLFGSGQQSFTGFFTERADYDFLVVAQGDGSRSRPFFNTSDVLPATERPDMEAAFPLITSLMATNHTRDGNFTLLPLFGVDENYSRGHVRSLTGNYTLNASSVVLSASAARRLNATVGESLPFFYFEGAVDVSKFSPTEFLTPELLALVRTANYTVAGVIEVDGRYPGGVSLYAVRGYAPTALQLNVTGKATQVLVLIDQSYYDITDTTDPSKRATALGATLATSLGPAYLVEAAKAVVLANAVQAARGTALIGQMFAVVFPAITGILVAGTLNLSVEEKARDLAVMRLIGARRRAVGSVLVWEAGLLLAIGVPLGLLIGVFSPALIVERFFASDQAVSVSPSTVATQVAIALGVTSAFLVIPLRRALAATPAEAVYQVRSQGEFRFVERRGVDIRLVLGGAILFMAILYATFAVPYILVFNQDEFLQFFMGSTLVLIASLGIALLWVAPPLEEALVRLLRPFTPSFNTLTVASIRRNIRRNASTNLIFALIVGILLFFASFFSGIISSVGVDADYSVGSDVRLVSFDSFSPPFAETVGSTPNVSQMALRPVSVFSSATNLVLSLGSNVQVIGLDPNLTRVIFKGPRDVVEGDISVLESLNNRSLVLSAITASHLKMHVGDSVALERGSHRDFFAVALILRSLPGFLETFQDQVTFGTNPGVFVSWDRYLEFADKNASSVRYSDIYLKAGEGADTGQLAHDFQDFYGLFVDFSPISRDQVVEQAQTFIAFLSFVSQVILVVLLLIAVFSLTVNLYASVKERAFEIGVVRSLGLRRRGVLGATLMEGLSIAFVSAFIGVVVGVFISFFVIFFFNIFSPIDIAYELPKGILFVLVAATGLFATVGSLAPARSVARRPIISLLRKIE